MTFQLAMDREDLSIALIELFQALGWTSVPFLNGAAAKP
jgi:hypothetical protein